MANGGWLYLETNIKATEQIYHGYIPTENFSQTTMVIRIYTYEYINIDHQIWNIHIDACACFSVHDDTEWRFYLSMDNFLYIIPRDALKFYLDWNRLIIIIIGHPEYRVLMQCAIQSTTIVLKNIYILTSMQKAQRTKKTMNDQKENISCVYVYIWI